MKVKIPLLLLLIVAGFIGYVLGTENGRQQRDAIVIRFRKQGTVDEAADEAADETTEEAPATVEESGTADQAAEEAAEPSAAAVEESGTADQADDANADPDAPATS